MAVGLLQMFEVHRVISAPEDRETANPIQTMKNTALINGQEIVEIVSANSHGIRLSRLLELVAERFGPNTRFNVGCHIGVDFDCLMVYLESHGILSIYDGVVFTSFPLARAM
jgi:hypothetical protein